MRQLSQDIEDGTFMYKRVADSKTKLKQIKSQRTYDGSETDSSFDLTEGDETPKREKETLNVRK